MLVKPGSSKRRRKEVFLLQGVRWGTQIAPEAVLANVVEEWPEMYAAAVQQNKTESVGGKYLIYGWEAAEQPVHVYAIRKNSNSTRRFPPQWLANWKRSKSSWRQAS
jgi:hypothetical protein